MKIPHKMGHSKSYKNKTMGQSLVEFSLILPFLLFIIFGIIDYGRILLVFSNASNAVRDAARQGTLVGNVTDATMGGSVPRYMACGVMTDLADDVFFATIDQVDVLYFSTEDTDSAGRAAIAAALEALDTSDVTTFEPADFSCNAARGGNPVISEDDVETGDLMVLLVTTRIDFITPFLSDAFPSFEITFRSQRTIVESLVLEVNGADMDGDGLLDQYEFERFGCVLANTNDFDADDFPNVPVYLLPDNSLLVNVGFDWSYLVPAQAATYSYGTVEDPDTAAVEYVAPDNVTQPTPRETATAHNTYTIPDDCARDDISKTIFNTVAPTRAEFDANFGHLQCDAALANASDEDDKTTYTNCIVIATGLFNSTSDPDGDGCNNGCEESRQTNPFDYVGGFLGEDTDGDGLTDAAEIGGGTDPLVRDSDGDGLWDGTERCEIFTDISETACASGPNPDAPVNSGVPYDYYYDQNVHTSNPYWSNTNPELADSDGDNRDDGFEYALYNPGDPDHLDPNDNDTDNDGLLDGRELDGFSLTININGISDTRTVFTQTGTDDTDGDGRTDFDEFNGYIVTIEGVDYTVTSWADDQDTDDDGVCDGAGAGVGCPTALDGSAVADAHPNNDDADGDVLTDYQEQITYGTLANTINSDADACGLTDTYEMLSTDATTDADNTATTPLDANSDGVYNALDLSSDGDGLTDCEEEALGSNPYSVDSDGDGYTDDEEVDPANWCLDILRDDSAITLPCGGSLLDADNGGSGDGYADAWEELYFGGSADTYDLTDPTDIAAVNALDSDGCDLACEYRNGTDPTLDDTDSDGLSDLEEDGNGSSGNDPDSDDDGLWDGQEGAVANGTCTNLALLQASGRGTFTNADCWATARNRADTDLDGISDGTEVSGSTTISVDRGSGPVIITITSDPLLFDTDGDNLSDGEEFNGISFTTTINGVLVTVNQLKSDPRDADTDDDGRSDYQESKLDRTYANDYDTDGDTISDGSHAYSGTVIGEQPNYQTPGSIATYNTNPLEVDSDNDGLTDLQEVTGFDITVVLYDSSGTQVSSNVITLAGYDPSLASPAPPTPISLDPNNADVDGDGENDGDEVTDTGVNDWVTNPLNANTDSDTAINDGTDNCPAHDNDAQQDLDSDGVGSVCDDSEVATFVFVDPISDMSSLLTATTWQPSVTVKAVDNLSDPQTGVDITVTFTDPNNGNAIVGTAQTCETVATGLCTVSLPSQLQTLTELDATVTALADEPAGLTYNSGLNDGPLRINVPNLSARVTAMSGTVSGTTSSWSISVDVTIEDDFGNAVQGVEVDFDLNTSGGTFIETITCSAPTDVNGQCTATSTGVLNASHGDAVVTINDIRNLGSLDYSPANNSPASITLNAPSLDIYVDAITGSSTGTPSAWEATADVTILDENLATVSGVTVAVDFEDAGGTVIASDTCTTNASGNCTTALATGAGLLDNTDTKVTVVVTGITNLGAYSYSNADVRNAADFDIDPPSYEYVNVVSTNNAAGGNSWTATLTVSVINDAGTVLNGRNVTVSYTATDRFGATSTGTRNCTTAGGDCDLVVSGLEARTTPGSRATINNVVFTITGVTGTTDTYTQTENLGFDSLSPSTIQVDR